MALVSLCVLLQTGRRMKTKEKGVWPKIPLSPPGNASFLFGTINQERTTRLPAPAEGVDAPNGLPACCADTTLNDSNIWKTAFHSDNLNFTDKQ